MNSISNKLLISCCNYGGGLYLIQIDTNEYTLSKLMDANCLGIAKFQDMYLLATSSHGVLLLDSNFKAIKTLHNQPVDYHGIFVQGSKAYIVETLNNTIKIYDLPEFTEAGEIAFSSGGEDINHINDLFVSGNKAYISMFSLDEPWRSAPENSGLILEYCLESRAATRIIYSGLKRPHSIINHKGNFFYCNSFEFEVNKNDQVIFKGDGFIRGLAIINNFIIIGQSSGRYTDYEHGIHVFNYFSLENRFIPIPSEEIYGILIP